MSTIRLFIALPIPNELVLIIHDWSKLLQTELPFRRWVDPANYHITLKFLGKTSNDKIDQIKENLHTASAGIKPFQLILKRLGSFGPSIAPTVLWAGIHGDLSQLRQLQKSIEHAMESIGFIKEERTFHPHITLARHFRGHTKVDQKILSSFSEQLNKNSVSWHVNHFNLYSSNPGIDPIYKIIESFNFTID